jgi:hypothetical protein
LRRLKSAETILPKARRPKPEAMAGALRHVNDREILIDKQARRRTSFHPVLMQGSAVAVEGRGAR